MPRKSLKYALPNHCDEIIVLQNTLQRPYYFALSFVSLFQDVGMLKKRIELQKSVIVLNINP